jgi:hypothetical protein
VVQLALFGRALDCRLNDFEAARQQVVDCARRRAPRQAEALAQLLEGTWICLRTQVEVAAEEQRRVAGPLGCRARRSPQILDRKRRLVVGCVQVGDAHARAGAGECHRPPLRLAFVNHQLAPLNDLTQLPATAHQRQIRSPLAGGDQIGIEAGGESPQATERVARGEHPVRFGFSGACEAIGVSRRALLQQGDVPLRSGQHRGELDLEVTVDLDVGRSPLFDPQ